VGWIDTLYRGARVKHPRVKPARAGATRISDPLDVCGSLDSLDGLPPPGGPTGLWDEVRVVAGRAPLTGAGPEGPKFCLEPPAALGFNR
jgi:hypothetical protein